MVANSLTAIPVLTAMARKSARSLMPSRPTICAPMKPQRARLGEAARPGPPCTPAAVDPLGHADHVRDAERRGQRSLNEMPPIIQSPAIIPQGTLDRLVPALAARRVGPRDLALGVGVAAGQALDGDLGHAVGISGAVARGPDVRRRGVHPLVHLDHTAGRAGPIPALAAAMAALASSSRYDGQVTRDVSVGGLHRAHRARPWWKPVSVVLKCSLAPFSCQESCTGAMMSGSVATGSAPGARVDQVRLDAAMTQRGDHLQAEREASTTTADFTPSRPLFHFIARGMFLTK